MGGIILKVGQSTVSVSTIMNDVFKALKYQLDS